MERRRLCEMATRKTLVLETRVAELGGQVRALKETKAEKTEVAAAVQRLLEAKAQLDDATTAGSAPCRRLWRPQDGRRLSRCVRQSTSS